MGSRAPLPGGGRELHFQDGVEDFARGAAPPAPGGPPLPPESSTYFHDGVESSTSRLPGGGRELHFQDGVESSTSRRGSRAHRVIVSFRGACQRLERLLVPTGALAHIWLERGGRGKPEAQGKASSPQPLPSSPSPGPQVLSLRRMEGPMHWRTRESMQLLLSSFDQLGACGTSNCPALLEGRSGSLELSSTCAARPKRKEDGGWWEGRGGARMWNEEGARGEGRG